MTRFWIFLFAAQKKYAALQKIIVRKIKRFAADSAAFKRRYSENPLRNFAIF